MEALAPPVHLGYHKRYIRDRAVGHGRLLIRRAELRVANLSTRTTTVLYVEKTHGIGGGLRC